jgi:hypothetical protein
MIRTFRDAITTIGSARNAGAELRICVERLTTWETSRRFLAIVRREERTATQTEMMTDGGLRDLTPLDKAILNYLIGPVHGHPELTAQALVARARGEADEFGGIFLVIPPNCPRAALTGGKLVAEGYWYQPTKPCLNYLWSEDGVMYSIEVLPGEAGKLGDIADIAQIEVTPNL